MMNKFDKDIEPFFRMLDDTIASCKGISEFWLNDNKPKCKNKKCSIPKEEIEPYIFEFSDDNEPKCQDYATDTNVSTPKEILTYSWIETQNGYEFHTNIQHKPDVELSVNVENESTLVISEYYDFNFNNYYEHRLTKRKYDMPSNFKRHGNVYGKIDKDTNCLVVYAEKESNEPKEGSNRVIEIEF